MRWFEAWWQRLPVFVRLAVVVASVVGMVLGGAADAYWQ
jgi:hypothetical protein